MRTFFRLSDYNIPSIYDGDVNLGKETTSNVNWHCFDPQISSSAPCFDPQISSSVPWTSSISSTVDVSSEHLPHENDLSLLRKIDIRSFKSLAQLRFAMEHHTVKQLRDLHRKSRVLLHVNLTNNRHVHEEILSVIEECEVVEKSAARNENVTSKSFSTLIEYGDALKEFQAAHRKLVDITEAILEAEKNHLSSMEKLERMKKKHHNVIRREFQPRRKRKTSV